MNDAHIHLVVNHLPIVGLLIGILVLSVGFLIKKLEVKLTGLGVFIFSALTSIVAFYTGEGAEEVIENMPGISETLIHRHEEHAETFFIAVLILGAISLITFILTLVKSKFSNLLMILCLVLALGSLVLAKNVGTSGGEIRHPEIRSDIKMIPVEKGDDD